MRILALDDGELALKALVEAVTEAEPLADVVAFRKPSEALAFAKDTVCDIAFLDIKMWGMNGLAVAKALKDINPITNIIFVTAYSEYAIEAFSLHPSGYVLKPVTKEAVGREIENLRHPVQERRIDKVFIQTFGNFEVFVYEKPIAFSSTKAKEALAFLVDRFGASVKASEIAAVLWEDKEYNRYLQNQIQKVISYMMRTLKENGIEDIIIKKWNQIAVDKTKFTCDYYRLLNWDTAAVNMYQGEYLVNYSWAEMTAGALSQRTIEPKT